MGIWLPVNQIRPWEGSLEAQALLKVIKKYCNIPQGLLDSVAIMRIIAIATAMAVAGVALHQTIHRTTSAQQWHQNAGPAWGSQTHIDQEINEQLIDLENAVLLLEDEVQNFKLQIHLKCDWNISSFCVTPHKYNQSVYTWINYLNL